MNNIDLSDPDFYELVDDSGVIYDNEENDEILEENENDFQCNSKAVMRVLLIIIIIMIIAYFILQYK